DDERDRRGRGHRLYVRSPLGWHGASTTKDEDERGGRGERERESRPRTPRGSSRRSGAPRAGASTNGARRARGTPSPPLGAHFDEGELEARLAFEPRRAGVAPRDVRDEAHLGVSLERSHDEALERPLVGMVAHGASIAARSRARIS